MDDLTDVPQPLQARILQSLGRMEGKLDSALQRVGGHDEDIDELRRQHEEQARRHSDDIAEVTAMVNAVDHGLTKVKAYVGAAWAAIVLLVSLVATIAGVIGLFR